MSEELQEEFFRYRPALLRELRRLVDAEEAEDFLQELFIHAMETARPAEHPWPYFYRMMLSRVRTHRRSGQRRAAREAAAQSNETSADDADPVREFETNERQAIAMEVIEALSEERRTTAGLWLIGLSVSEISAALSVNRTTVERRLRFVERAIHGRLERAGYV